MLSLCLLPFLFSFSYSYVPTELVVLARGLVLPKPYFETTNVMRNVCEEKREEFFSNFRGNLSREEIKEELLNWAKQMDSEGLSGMKKKVKTLVASWEKWIKNAETRITSNIQKLLAFTNSCYANSSSCDTLFMKLPAPFQKMYSLAASSSSTPILPPVSPLPPLPSLFPPLPPSSPPIVPSFPPLPTIPPQSASVPSLPYPTYPSPQSVISLNPSPVSPSLLLPTSVPQLNRTVLPAVNAGSPQPLPTLEIQVETARSLPPTLNLTSSASTTTSTVVPASQALPVQNSSSSSQQTNISSTTVVPLGSPQPLPTVLSAVEVAPTLPAVVNPMSCSPLSPAVNASNPSTSITLQNSSSALRQPSNLSDTSIPPEMNAGSPQPLPTLVNEVEIVSAVPVASNAMSSPSLSAVNSSSSPPSLPLQNSPSANSFPTSITSAMNASLQPLPTLASQMEASAPLPSIMNPASSIPSIVSVVNAIPPSQTLLLQNSATTAPQQAISSVPPQPVPTVLSQYEVAPSLPKISNLLTSLPSVASMANPMPASVYLSPAPPEEPNSYASTVPPTVSSSQPSLSLSYQMQYFSSLSPLDLSSYSMNSPSLPSSDIPLSPSILQPSPAAPQPLTASSANRGKRDIQVALVTRSGSRINLIFDSSSQEQVEPITNLTETDALMNVINEGEGSGLMGMEGSGDELLEGSAVPSPLIDEEIEEDGFNDDRWKSWDEIKNTNMFDDIDDEDGSDYGESFPDMGESSEEGELYDDTNGTLTQEWPFSSSNLSAANATLMQVNTTFSQLFTVLHNESLSITDTKSLLSTIYKETSIPERKIHRILIALADIPSLFVKRNVSLAGSCYNSTNEVLS